MTRRDETYDPEGIAVAPDYTLWVASEGDDPGSRANLLVQVDKAGNVLQEVPLPQEIETCRAASEDTGNLDNGVEGVTVVPRYAHGQEGRYVLAVAQQLPWFYTSAGCVELGDMDGYTRIWFYDPDDGDWDSVAYELAPVPADSSWVGLSEITWVPGKGLVLIERDNRTGDFSGLKTLVLVKPRALKDGVISADEKVVYDLTGDLRASNGWITDKPEGVAVTSDGTVYLVTDNDGVEDWSGETTFLELGSMKQLFGRGHDDKTGYGHRR